MLYLVNFTVVADIVHVTFDSGSPVLEYGIGKAEESSALFSTLIEPGELVPFFIRIFFRISVSSFLHMSRK